MAIKNFKDIKSFNLFFNKSFRKQMRISAYRSLNKVAYETSKTIKEQTLGKAFVLRNNFAKRSIAYEKPASYSIDKMESRVGQIKEFKNKNGDIKKAGFLGVHETGGSIVAKKGAIAEATKFSRKGNYKKAVSRSYYFNKSKDTLTTENTGLNNNRLAAFALRSKTKKKVLLHNRKKKLGAYVVKNGKLFKAYSLDKQKKHIKKQTWLAPAVNKNIHLIKKTFFEELNK